MVEEVRECAGIARRIAAILPLEPELDTNYRGVAADGNRWVREAVGAGWGRYECGDGAGGKGSSVAVIRLGGRLGIAGN